MNIINLLSDNNNNRKEFLYNEYNENNEYNEFYRLSAFTDFLETRDFLRMKELLIAAIFGTGQGSKPAYGHTSIGWYPEYAPHWSVSLSNHDFFNNYLFSKIQELYKWTRDLTIMRIYTSIQVTGNTGNWHVDDNDPDSFTFVIYCNLSTYLTTDKENYHIYEKVLQGSNRMNLSKKDDDDGYFHIKYPNKPIQFFKTRDNTAMLFNSTLIHLGDCSQCDSTNTRCVVAYKLKKKNE